jgi:hypothetical protein
MVEGCQPTDQYIERAGDCDDVEAEVNPDASEVCNERDDDCDDEVDEGVTLTFFLDGDGDGYGRLDATTEACTEPAGYASEGGDCDDALPEVNPGATEVCNGMDDDCDSLVDDDDSSVSGMSTFYADADTDGYGDAAAPQLACEAPVGTVTDATDCDDTSAEVSPADIEVCNGIDDDCDGDTDDDDSSVTDRSTWYVDGDGDGYGTTDATTEACFEPSGYAAADTDCDDSNTATYPLASEICDGEDNDCDSDIDEGVIGVSASCAAESCFEILDLGSSTGDGSYYLDPDGSGASLWECDMTTDGGGWTRVTNWNRVDDGDTKTDFTSEFTVLFNNMDTFTNGSNHLFWQDDDGRGRANADALSVEKDIPVTNSGEILYTVEYDGVSMEQSGTWLWVESAGTEFNLECWQAITTSAYSSTELSQRPSYSCTNTSSSDDFSWAGTVQDDLGSALDTLRFTSLHYDSCCDYSYLYMIEAWVR